MSAPVDTQIIAAIKALLLAAGTDAIGVHEDRGEDEPFEPAELPAINILPVDESVDRDSLNGYAVGVPCLQVHRLQIVVQVVARSTSDAMAQARLISAQCAAAIASAPTLGGICSQTLYPTAKQWLREDGAAQALARQNTLFQGGYRTWSNDPFTSV